VAERDQNEARHGEDVGKRNGIQGEHGVGARAALTEIGGRPVEEAGRTHACREPPSIVGPVRVTMLQTSQFTGGIGPSSGSGIAVIG
jgi:hypothetical protein